MATEKAGKYVSSKISRLKREGYKDPKQRVAIALSMAREEGYDVGSKPSKEKSK